MRLKLQAFIALASVALSTGCGPAAPAAVIFTASGGSGGASASGAGSDGTAGPHAGSSSGGNAGGGSTGASGSAGTPSAGGSSAGAAGAGSGGASGTSGTIQTNFNCNEYLGLLTTNEWYSQGFETDGVDAAKWQLKYHHYGYVGTWADPNSIFWSDTGDSFDLAKGSPIQSPCALSSAAPDRLVFAALDWEMQSEAAWVAALEAALVTFKAKYPSLRRIDLMTMIRCPGNQQCNPNASYGPGANASAARQDCYVPAFEDSAIAKVAALHPELVGVGPKVEALACRMPVDGAHLSAESNQHAAQVIATYYAAHP